jgi:MATE family multidrug resistance protein
MEDPRDIHEKLLQHSSDSHQGHTHPHKNHPHISVWRAAYSIVGDAVPATFGLLFIFICETINIIFIGRYDDPDMIAGIGIGTLYINATGYILGAGLIGGLDTLCSQAYGAKEYRLLGIFANIGRFIIFLFFILISIPFIIYSSNLLSLIGQYAEVCDIASRFCHFMIPSLFFALQYNTSLRYLQAMNIFLPGMFVTFSTAILHPLWCYIFIDNLGMDVGGAGIAMGITQILNYIIITIYIHIRNPTPESYFFFNKDCFDGKLIWDYLRKGVPAAILFAADWLGFEVLTLMSSYISPAALAANVCLFNFITLIFMIPMGLSFASTTLVGNSIGERNVNKAKSYTYAALGVGICMIGIITILVLIYKKEVPYVYTSEVLIADMVTGLLGIYVCFSIVDAIQIILHGVIKGLGMQKLASIVCLIILYPINIPMAYSLAFTWGYGLMGLWYSQLVSVFLLAISYIIICLSVNWHNIAEQAVKLFKEEEVELIRRHSKQL